MENKNLDKIHNQNNENTKKEFYSALAKLITTENFQQLFSFIERILEYNKDVENKKNETIKNRQYINLTGWKWRFTKDFGVVFILSFLIFCLAYNDKIETSTTSTLVGSLIGYAVGKNYNNQNK